MTKKFYFNTYISVAFIICIIVTYIYSIIYRDNHIQKADFSICLNEDTENFFKDEFDEKSKLYKYYNYTISSNPEDSDLILTSDINAINTKKNYSVKGYSPLIICLEDSKDLNNYLKSKSKKGFLTCNSSSKIKNTSSDEIVCDFSIIINAVLEGKNWSDLGGNNDKIKIYCPLENTVDGNLFYQFLLITINDGRYPKDNLTEIEEKANTFLNSSNVIQTDVADKISKLGDSSIGNDIYCLFEEDFLSAANSEADISIAYPAVTVSKNIYLQFNNSKLKKGLTDAFKGNLFEDSVFSDLYYSEFYRSSDHQISSRQDINFNVKDGFNNYKLPKS